MEFFTQLFASDLMPHGYCLLWRPEIVWLHVVSDALIALAYYSIPITLACFVRRRRDLPFPWMFLFFAGFIFACGTTHLMAIWTMWEGAYWLEGAVKALTAIVSLGAAALLVPLTPKALALRSPKELEELNVALEREIAERRRAEQELTATLARLEQRVAERTAELASRNAELEQFSYVASHDLQEPLRTVSGYVQLLSKRYQGQLDAQAHEFIGYSIDGVKRMQGLIDALLAYSRLDRKGRELEPVDAESCVRDALANLRRSIEENQAAITCSPMPRVQGNRAQLVQLFQNLVGNAIRYRGERKPEIKLTVRVEGRECVFSVEDNGVGIEQRTSRVSLSPSSVCMGMACTKGRGSASLCARRSWSGTKAVFGSSQSLARARFFALPCPRPNEGRAGRTPVLVSGWRNPHRKRALHPSVRTCRV